MKALFEDPNVTAIFETVNHIPQKRGYIVATKITLLDGTSVISITQGIDFICKHLKSVLNSVSVKRYKIADFAILNQREFEVIKTDKRFQTEEAIKLFI